MNIYYKNKLIITSYEATEQDIEWKDKDVRVEQ